MQRKNYSKPRMAFEEFRTDSYCATCSISQSHLIWSPVPENNGYDGWQQYNGPVPGVNIDADHAYPAVINSHYLGIDSYEKILVEHEPLSDCTPYYKIVLHSEGVVYTQNKKQKTGVTYPAGTVFYKNYNAPLTDFQDDTKTRS